MDKAYRGYLIRFNPMNGYCWIEKDSIVICSVPDESTAVEMIDDLLDY